MVTLTKSQKIFLAMLGAVTLFAVVGTVWWTIVRQGDSQAEQAFYASDSSGEQYKDLQGNVVDMTDTLQDVTVVTLWASWSPYSRDELGIVNTLAAEFSSQGVSFVALNRKESKEQAQRFLATLPEFTNITYVIDTADTYYTAVGGYTMPETVIYNKDGDVVDHIRVVLTEDMLRSAVTKALESN